MHQKLAIVVWLWWGMNVGIVSGAELDSPSLLLEVIYEPIAQLSYTEHYSDWRLARQRPRDLGLLAKGADYSCKLVATIWKAKGEEFKRTELSPSAEKQPDVPLSELMKLPEIGQISISPVKNIDGTRIYSWREYEPCTSTSLTRRMHGKYDDIVIRFTIPSAIVFPLYEFAELNGNPTTLVEKENRPADLSLRVHVQFAADKMEPHHGFGFSPTDQLDQYTDLRAAVDPLANVDAAPQIQRRTEFEPMTWEEFAAEFARKHHLKQVVISVRKEDAQVMPCNVNELYKIVEGTEVPRLLNERNLFSLGFGSISYNR